MPVWLKLYRACGKPLGSKKFLAPKALFELNSNRLPCRPLEPRRVEASRILPPALPFCASKLLVIRLTCCDASTGVTYMLVPVNGSRFSTPSSLRSFERLFCPLASQKRLRCGSVSAEDVVCGGVTPGNNCTRS